MITRINYNNQVRDSVFQATSVEAVKDMYKALRLFDELAYKPENQIIYKLKPGKSLKNSKMYLDIFTFFLR
jgi:hypothetical protein